jgi:hypothetical protein
MNTLIRNLSDALAAGISKERSKEDFRRKENASGSATCGAVFLRRFLRAAERRRLKHIIS